MSQLSYLLLQAEQAMIEGNWEEAQRFYQQALDLEPDNPKADQGLRQSQRASEKEAEIKQRIADADVLFAQGDYRGAANEYISITDYAVATPRILKFHPELERKRNQAKDLHTWQERVRKALAEVQKLNAAGDWEAAAKITEEVLQQLPPEPAYQPLRSDLESARANALSQGDHQGLLRKAQEFFRAKEYEQGIVLLENILPSSLLHADAQRLLRQARDYLATQKRDMAGIETAIAEGRWTDALAQLDQWRDRYQTVPLWQQLYLKAGMTYGRLMLENGRQENQRREFDQARRRFESAQRAFEEVLKIYPTHPDAKTLCEESKDLIAITALQAQAQLDWDAGRRDAAFQSLKLAQQRLEYASSEGRDYTAVGAVVEIMHNTLQAEIERIREEERRLRNAESLWERNELSQARTLFEETLGALLPERRRQAAEGLRRVETKIKQFESLMARGQVANDAFAAASAYQEAYNLWPAGPGAAEALENTLVNACESALSAGREREAAEYVDRALQLNPDNRKASDYQRKISTKPQVEATLKRVTEEWAVLQRQDTLQASALEPLLQDLETALRQVAEWPDLREGLAALYQTLREAHTAWQEYEQAYARAAQSRGQGDWAAAVTALGQAIQEMGAAAPAGAQRQLTAWRDIAQKLAETRGFAQTALEQVQAAYIAAAARPLGEMADALDEAVRRHAEPARQRLEETAAQATQAGGAWPADLVTLQKQLQGLAERATAAANAARTPAAAEGLLKIQEIIQLRGSDPTLEAVRTQLEERAREKITNTKIEAQTAIQAGDLAEAEEKLRLVRDLDPNDQAVAQLYAGIRQRRTIEEQLRTVEREAEAKQAGSPVDAMKTWRRGLNLLLEPDVPLPAQVREILNTLIALGDRNDGLALGQADNWQTAQDRLAELGQLRQESWAAGRAQFFADQWIRLARDNALRGVIASEAQLGHLLEAYRAAAEYIKGHPRDPEAIQQLTERTEALINRANEAADKRVQRARSALDTGEFAAALSNLQDIEREFYQPIEQEFPDLLKGQPAVQEMRDTIAQLQAQAQRLQTLHNQASPEIEKARQAYLNNEWDAAEKVLATLLSLQGLPDMEAEVKRLREQIAQARIAATRKRLHDTLSQIETGYHLATTVEQVSAYLERLEELAKEIHLQVLEVDERQRYFQVLSAVRDQREALKASVEWEQLIEPCVQKKDYAGALKAIEETLKTVLDGSKRPKLAMRRGEIERLATEEHEREAALKAGQEAFAEEKYTEARLYFEKAGRWGAEVAELIRAARAGAKLQSARRWWDKDHDADRALADLDDVDRFAEHNPLAKDIAEDASVLRSRIGEARQRTQEVQRALAEAQRMLADGQFEQAQESVKKILEREPAFQEALALQTQIRDHRDAQKMLEDARVAQQEGKYQDALHLVETVLEKQPDNPQARLLKRQVEAVINADKAFLQVETLAKQKRFKEARERLTELSQQEADPEKLRQVQQLVDELEKEEWTRVVHPIQELFRDGEYAEAWDRCKQASSRTAAPELLDELRTLQSLIVNRWAEKQAQAARAQLQKPPEQEQLRELEAQLEPFLHLEPPPEGHWVRQLEDLLRETRTRRLRVRLEQARERFEEWRKGGIRGAPQAALDIIKVVQEEAEALNTQVEFDITLDATALNAEIQEALRVRDIEARDAEYKRLMSKALELRRQLEDASYIAEKSPGRVDLERIVEGVNPVFKIPGYENDAAARALVTWAQNALEIYDRTQQALDEAQRLARQRRFRDAEYELRGTSVSLLLKTAHERQREILGALSRAEIHQNNEAWDLALQEYRQALALDASFQPLLEKELERCYQRLHERVTAEVETSLNQTPPNTTAACATLKKAEDAGWITPLVRRDYDRLRNWLESQEFVVQAVTLLQAQEGSLAEAKKALQEARRLIPDGQADTAIRQWESLLEALLAWEAYRQNGSLLSRALEAFRNLKLPIKDLPRVQTLLQALEKADHAARTQAAEAAEKQQLLRQLKQKIGEALSTPQDYNGAVQALENASPKITGESPFTAQCIRVRDDLRTTIESVIKELHYAQALELAEILKHVPQLDQDTRDWAAGLPGARRTAFNERLQAAEAALQRHDEQGVLAALSDAETILAPEGDREGRITDVRARLLGAKLATAIVEVEKAMGVYDISAAESALEKARKIVAVPGADQRLKDLAERIQALRALLDRVHNDLRELHTEIGEKQWRVAVRRLLKVRSEAPGYPRVQSAIVDLQERLRVQAESQHKAGEFSTGLELCDLALSLDPRDDIRTLQQQIREEQGAALVKIQQSIQAGLDAWRLGALPGLFAQGFKIAPADAGLRNLKERFDAVEAMLPDLRHAMNQGWDALLNRDYPAAISAYNQALSLAPHFTEAQIWRDYIQTMQDAVRRIENNDFEPAARQLRDAENLVCVTTEQSLPDVLTSEAHLKERRRHAAYNAWQLRQSALRMAAFYKMTDYYFERQDTGRMNEFYDKITDENKRFQDILLKPLTPPDTFPATGKEDDPLPPEAVLPTPTDGTQPAGGGPNSPMGNRGPAGKPQPIPEKKPAPEPKATSPEPVARPPQRGQPEAPPTPAPEPSTPTAAAPGAETPASPSGTPKPGMRDKETTPSPSPTGPEPVAPSSTPVKPESSDNGAEETPIGLGSGWNSGFWANSDYYGDEDSKP